MNLPLLLVLSAPTSLVSPFLAQEAVSKEPSTTCHTCLDREATSGFYSPTHLVQALPTARRVDRRIIFSAEQMDTAFTLAWSASPIETTVGITPSLSFPPHIGTSILFSIEVPADWDGNSDLDVRIVSSSPDTVGVVAWHVDYAVIGEGGTSPSTGTRLGVLSTVSATPNGRVTTSPVTVPSWLLKSGDLVSLNLLRDGNSGADTLDGNVNVHLVSIAYKAKR